MSYELVQKYVDTPDGARIAYQVAGEGPVLVLANGLGGNAAAWRFLFERFAPNYRVISWDYRGLFQSGPSPATSKLDPPEQALDLFTILEAEHVDRFVLAGWSMGVQVALEVYRAAPQRVAALALINGVAGRPFDTAFSWSGSRSFLPSMINFWGRSNSLIVPLLRGAVRYHGLLPMLKRMKLVGKSLNEDIFLEVARDYVHLDFKVYRATLQALGQHDARDMLTSITVPTTIIAGDHDVMTPLEAARAMATVVPNAKLAVVEGGTHYTPIEFADRVGDEIEGLLAQSDLGI